MNNDQQLKLQSYLDGELSPRESRQVTQLLAVDGDARALLTELKNTTTALKGNELEMKLPESRDFFFSKIQHQIEREAQAQTQRTAVQVPFFARLRRYILPLAGATVAVILFATMSKNQTSMGFAAGEGESSGAMTAYTFRSQSDHMTVVWLADNSATSSTDNTSEATEIQ